MEVISFQFTGGMADGHELNFYEAGRFQYGAARFIYGLERFRQTGEVLSRLSTKVEADFRIRAAKEGSFLQEVVVNALPAITVSFLACPFEAIFAYAWDKLLPKSDKIELAVKLGEIELAREKERTVQESERTKQLIALTDSSRGANANTATALELIKIVLENARADQLPRSGHTLNELEVAKTELEDQNFREKLISSNMEQLRKITPEQERKLSGQLRKSVADIGLPLRSSATALNVSGNGKKYVARLDEETISGIVDVDEDETPNVIRGKIKSYDTESGVGKFRFQGLPHPISFRVPSAYIAEMKSEMLDAMKLTDVLLRVYFTRDNFGNPISMLVDGILENDPLDDL